MDAELQSASPTELDPTLDVELVLWLKGHYRLILYRLLARGLLLCGCLRSALTYLKQALRMYPGDRELTSIHFAVLRAGAKLEGKSLSMDSPPNDWPDSGFVRREQYAWNGYEPDRINMLHELNTLMRNASDKLEVRAVDLPALSGGPDEVSTQLGVFAKTDIAPSEEILNETSLLTANNKLLDALCDACSADLPDLKSKEGEAVSSCPECEVVFCSQFCYNEAMESYHPALCDKDIEAIAKDVPPAQAADSLYSLLLLRSLAMAETQGVHPLQLHEVKYIWGDFTPIPHIEGKPIYTDPNDPSSCTVALALPFSFEHNVRLPFHMLEKMDIDIFANHQYDVWVFNTLYAKFRGTASARLSGLGGRAVRGPEVSAVHPMWCLANHSCDPNVSWEWGGSIKFWTRKERAQWRGKDGRRVVKSKAGIRKGEEVVNHYCDIDLPVKERREWARGALGGDCMCERCVYEVAQEEGSR
ncbi:hypothetical protein DOTSEDRAFT_162496 [Dothistroma septosporum NZE10]|uniref:SET domain-containing protein n=1 Tax=Dothistroma septosporum (strain NZE10 / CBS 128990) TaxID=675120 RepID=N1PZ92_DOTSN|nr:hypothetical protein DOTSEDRAFT_162496 [Dothistroma septosporum NZE10]